MRLLPLGVLLQILFQPSSGTAAFPIQRGVNLSNRFVYVTSPGEVSLSEASRIRKLGFDHVRLPVDFEILLEPVGTSRDLVFRKAAIARLDRSIARLTDAGLRVILDFHPAAPFFGAGGAGPSFGERTAFLVSLWKSLAVRYAALPFDQVAFSVLNEPDTDDRGSWENALNEVVAAVREVSPERVVMVSPPSLGTSEALATMQPLKARNIVYDFHFYRPGVFTHQGATWSLPYQADLRNVPYPFGPGETAMIARQIKTEENRKAFIQSYSGQLWDSARISALIDAVAEWAKRSDAVVACEEFGVYRKYAPKEDRLRWLRDVRQALEKRGVAWAVWDYDGNFDVLDSATLEALLPRRQ